MEDKETRIVLIGKTGTGKSTTGNGILGQELFPSGVSGSSVTRKCQLGHAHRFGRKLQVIDTPGLFDTGMSNEEITQEIRKCIGMCAPGPHAIVLVVRVDRFTQEESDTVDHFRMIFGEGMLDHLVVLFTRRDDLEYDNVTINDHVKRVPQNLRDLLHACNDRYVAFNNRAPPATRERDVKELLRIIDDMVTDNDGTCYSTEMFSEAERIMSEREQILRREHEETVAKERQKMIDEVEGEMSRTMANKNEVVEQMTAQIKQMEAQQSSAASEEIASLRKEVGQLRELVQEIEESSRQERQRMQEELARREALLTQNTPDFRVQVRQQVNQEESGIMKLLNTGLKDLWGVVMKVINGPVFQSAVETVTSAVFNKVATKINPGKNPTKKK